MPVIIPAAIAGGQTLLGLGQTIAANKKRKQAEGMLANNPYKIPESQVRASNIAASQSRSTQLPAQELMQERIASNTAQGVSAARATATSPSQVLQQTVNSYLNQQQQNSALDLQAAQNYQIRQQGYQNVLVSLSPYEQKKWEYNTLFPAQALMNASADQQQTGMANIGQGISSGLSVFANSQYLSGLNPQSSAVGSAPIQPPLVQPQPNFGSSWWGGGQPDNSIQQRQGTFGF